MGALTIGSLVLDSNLALAPMAGITDQCVRRIASRLGASIVWSEMISATALVRGSGRALKALDKSDVEAKISLQIVGADPVEMAHAASIAQQAGASLVDINAGCPVRKVCRTGAGAALLRHPRLLGTIINSVRSSVSCPVTVKIRSGWDQDHINASEIARIAEDSGADAVILHARTASQGFKAKANWDLVRRLKQERTIPIIGNGDIDSPQAAKDALQNTACDGIMIGRAARGNPWLFERIRLYLDKDLLVPGPSLEERKEMMLMHLEWALSSYGSEAGTRSIRPHLAWYVKGLPMSHLFRRELFRTFQPASLEVLTKRYFDQLQCQGQSMRESEEAP